MGNQMSVPQRVQDEEHECKAGTYKAASDSECSQNGTPVVISACTVQHCSEVDLGISIQKDNVATSSPKTMEIDTVADASGKNLGKEAKPEAPAAKSRFFLTLSPLVLGRTGDQDTDSSTAAAKLDVSSNTALANKDPSDSPALLGAAALGLATDKSPGLSPAGDQALPATGAQAPLPPESVCEAASKRKDSSFFDKFFKLDKGREKAEAEDQQEARKVEHPDTKAEEAPRLSRVSRGVQTGEDIVDSKETEGQEIETSNCSVPGDPEGLESAREDSPTAGTTENNSVMSFFKTLVSPNKAETKRDPEDTASKAESVCDGQAGQKTSETQGKGSKKKHLESPRLGLAFRKLFRHQGAEKSPSTAGNLKSDKASSTPQDTPGGTQSPKGSQAGQAAPTATGAAKDSGKKTGPTSLPLGKLFWKKSVKEESVPTGAEENVVCESPVETVKSEEVESTLQTVDLSEDRDSLPEPAEVKRKREEGKPRRSSLMTFFRQVSVKGDGGIAHSEEIMGKDSNNQTSNSTEKAPAPKATTPPGPEPTGAAQRGKEASAKDKKSAEVNKQKNKQQAKEPGQSVEQAAAEPSALQSGDKAQKRAERRRQSLGGFLKGLGPKRMSDAQVQTDPVSIGPPGKSK
ncbi:breast carcinoma-amplified sequence 1 [Fukomys damarensis]|uniref:breast carcinoma-amplified sequence 1 n=1 Tax=Fukomys damarensis TaxID=885580 RepID=UPI001455C53F|nr:breast carcinoma-amplified sequence 1 [Fukomys damarensis]